MNVSNVSHGMDTASVEALGRTLQRVAGELEGWLLQLDRSVTSAKWSGPDAVRFKTGWWPAHKNDVQAVVQDLRGFGQSALNNVSEQLRASDADGVGHGGQPYEVRTDSWEREARFGLGGEGVETGAVDVVQMSDGTWHVRVGNTSSFQLSAGDIIGVGSLIPGAQALRMLHGAGIDVRTLNTGLDIEYSLPDEASARRLAAALERQFSGMDTLDGLSESEIVKEAMAEKARGTDISVVSASRTTHGTDVAGTMDVGGLEVDYKSSSLSHGVSVEDQAIVDTLTRGGVVRGAIGPFEMAAGEEVSVLRSPSGEVVGLTVRTVTTASGQVDLSSASVLSALGVKDYGTNISGGVATGAIAQTTTTYDLSDPRFSEVAMAIGCTDPNARMSATEIDHLVDAARRDSAPAATTTEVYRTSETTSGGGLLWSADFKTDKGSMELVYRS